jgi:hypothetical protein
VEYPVLDAVDRAIAESEPHVAAVLDGDSRYTDALAAVEDAQRTLDEFRDDVAVQTALGMKAFVAGLEVRKAAIEIARKHLREQPRPAGSRSRKKMTVAELDIADRRQLYARLVAEVRVYPRKAPHRVTLRWAGAESAIPLVTDPRSKSGVPTP